MEPTDIESSYLRYYLLNTIYQKYLSGQDVYIDGKRISIPSSIIDFGINIPEAQGGGYQLEAIRKKPFKELDNEELGVMFGVIQSRIPEIESKIEFLMGWNKGRYNQILDEYFSLTRTYITNAFPTAFPSGHPKWNVNLLSQYIHLVTDHMESLGFFQKGIINQERYNNEPNLIFSRLSMSKEAAKKMIALNNIDKKALELFEQGKPKEAVEYFKKSYINYYKEKGEKIPETDLKEIDRFKGEIEFRTLMKEGKEREAFKLSSENEYRLSLKYPKLSTYSVKTTYTPLPAPVIAPETTKNIKLDYISSQADKKATTNYDEGLQYLKTELSKLYGKTLPKTAIQIIDSYIYTNTSKKLRNNGEDEKARKVELAYDAKHPVKMDLAINNQKDYTKEFLAAVPNTYSKGMQMDRLENEVLKKIYEGEGTSKEVIASFQKATRKLFGNKITPEIQKRMKSVTDDIISIDMRRNGASDAEISKALQNKNRNLAPQKTLKRFS